MKIDEIIRSNRKSISLEIKPDGRLTVRAPRHATLKQIQVVVTAKEDWIRKSKIKITKRYPVQKPRSFQPGETFWYLGEKYPLKLVNRQRPTLDLDGAFLLSQTAISDPKAVFVEWYREETRAITQEIIARYAQHYPFKLNKVRITSARTRWGSCSGKNNINFSYRLCMAPLSVVEYVVVHELAHLMQHNHSQAFWNIVAKMKPDFQADKRWLKNYGYLLNLD